MALIQNLWCSDYNLYKLILVMAICTYKLQFIIKIVILVFVLAEVQQELKNCRIMVQRCKYYCIYVTVMFPAFVCTSPASCLTPSRHCKSRLSVTQDESEKKRPLKIETATAVVKQQ